MEDFKTKLGQLLQMILGRSCVKEDMQYECWFCEQRELWSCKLTIPDQGVFQSDGCASAKDAKQSSASKAIIKLKSTAGTGYTYVTRKNKINTRERITLMKYDPVVRRHVEFKEDR